MSTIRVKGPANFGGFSHDGESYAPDDEGVIEVPAHLPSDVLASHSLTDAPAKVVKPLAKDGTPKGKTPLAKSQTEEEMAEIAATEKPVKEDATKAAKGAK